MKRALKITGFLILVPLWLAGVAAGSWAVYEIGKAVSEWLK